MIRTIVFLICGQLFFLSSCERSNGKEDKGQLTKNELVVTTKGDTLERGIWIYDSGANGVSAKGTYANGFKTDIWTYSTSEDTVNVTWRVFDKGDIKFNVPDWFNVIGDEKPPILFRGDIPDNDSNTYLVLLRYDLKQLNSSVYDYLYQYDESWENNPDEVLKSKEYKKYYFPRVNVFRAKVETQGKIQYEAISYIFVVNDDLYDLTLKNARWKSNPIELEVLNDILYSIECQNVDLFNHNNRKYIKEEIIEFKRSFVN